MKKKMKKVSLYIMALLSSGLVSCNQDFETIFSPQTNAQESLLQASDVTVANTTPTTINLADYFDEAAGTTKAIPIGTASVKEGAMPANTILKAMVEFSKDADFSSSIMLNANSLDGSNEISVNPNLLQDSYFNDITRNPATTDLYIRTILYTVTGGTSEAIVGKPEENYYAQSTVKFTPLNKVQISSAYYLIGGPNDWAKSAADRLIKFNHSGKDVYDDPVFTVVFDAKQDDDTWFAFGDDAACDAIGEGNWSKLFGIVGGDSETKEGRFDFRYNLGSDNSFKVAKGAKKIQLIVDMMDFTFTVKTLDFDEYLYEAGNNNGWGNPVDYLYGGNNDGKYVGFMYLDGEFKFRSHENSWDAPDWGAGSSDGTLAEQGKNLTAEAGYYQVNADLATLTYSLTKITTIGIIGPAQKGGWDSDTDMTYNKETGAWESTINLDAGEMKFRANDGWDINWGGTEKALTQGGANIKIAEAGNYFVQLFAYCDGKAYYKITKK